MQDEKEGACEALKMECLVAYWDGREHVSKELTLPSLEEALAFAGWHPGSTVLRAEDRAYYDRLSGVFIPFRGGGNG